MPSGAASRGSGSLRLRSLWQTLSSGASLSPRSPASAATQIAAIALSYLVYTRSNSPFLAVASTYAVTYVPWVFGSILLAPLVDRLARRAVMVVCDLGRAVTIALLALATTVHHMPIPVLIALVLISSCFSAPYSAARAAILPGHFRDRPGLCRRGRDQPDPATDRLGVRLRTGRHHRGRGVAVGRARDRLGHVRRVVPCHARVGTRTAPPPVVDGRANLRSLFVDIVPNFRLVLRSRTRRAMLLLSAAALLFLIAPEGLAVAYAREHGHGAVAAGLLTAAQPLGIAVGAWLFIKYVPARRQGQLLLPLAGTGAAVLTLTALVPPIWLACVIWGLAGVMQCFLVTTIAAYNVGTERELRGRANGIASATIAVSQGLGFLIWGAVGEWRGAAAGVAWAGVAGLLIMSLVRFSWPYDDIEVAWDNLDAAQRSVS